MCVCEELGLFWYEHVDLKLRKAMSLNDKIMQKF